MCESTELYKLLEESRKMQLSMHISKYARICDALYITHVFPHMDSKSYDKGLTEIIKKN